jgi:hypothetical protein
MTAFRDFGPGESRTLHGRESIVTQAGMALASFRHKHGLTGDAPVLATKSASRKDLCALFAAMGFRRGAEIGVWKGGFSELICQANPGVSLVCVDPWQSYDDYVDPKNVKEKIEGARLEAERRLAPYRCEIRRMTSTAAAATVPDGSLDFVFIDGNHAKAYVLADLEAWAPKVRSGGLVSGHDYELDRRHAHLQVRDAVDAFAQQHKIAPIYVVTNDKTPSFFWRVP